MARRVGSPRGDERTDLVYGLCQVARPAERPLELPRRCLRQAAGGDEPHLERGYPDDVADAVDDFVAELIRRVDPGLGDHDDRLFAAATFDPEGDDVASTHSFNAGGGAFDLFRIDVAAADVDHVLDATADDDLAV